MITADRIIELLSRSVVTSEVADGIRVSTHVLYPSNGSVSVVVRGGENSFMISDEGGGISDLRSVGIKSIVTDKAIKAKIRSQGLKVKDGVIMSPLVPLEAVPAAILLVANASRMIADWGLTHLPITMPRNFRADLAQLLERYFQDSVKNDERIVGKSNKAHKFGHIVYLPNNRKLLIDPVVNDASSINSALVSNLDVKMNEDPQIRQLIIYDDSLSWRSSDLKLLEMGAPTVAFSHAPIEIRRVAA